jgi:C-terminal processing protease CtpA/Prc
MRRSLVLLALFGSLSLSAAELSVDQRLAGLATVWSEVKFNFANFDLVPKLEWDAEFAAYIPGVRAAKNDTEYYRLLQELVAKLHDGHTYLWPPAEMQAHWYATPRLTTELIEGKVIVTGMYDPAGGVSVGDELLAIDGVPVRDYAETRVRPYIFSSTPQDSDNRTYRWLLLGGDDGSRVKLAFRDAGEKTLTRTNESFGPPKPLVSLRVLEGNVGLLTVNSFNDDQLRGRYDELWRQVEKTDALIIDIRGNGGGDTSNGRHILKTLTDKPFQESRWRTRMYLPVNRAWNEPAQWEQHEGKFQRPDGKRHYAKPVAVLIGPRTFSAAEDFAVAFDAMERGIFVGMPTGGSTGQPLLITLPGAGILGICTKRDQYPDGREFVGVGVQPDIVVATTVEDVRKGRDPVLERALAALTASASSPR